MSKAALVLGASLLACAAASAQDLASPRRIVSLNLCTDQLLMLLVEPERIAAVTRLAADPRASASAETAAGLHAIRGTAEEVFALEPDLVLAGTFTTRPTVSLLRRLAVPIVEIAPETSLDDIRRNIEAVGQAVGEPERAAALVAAFDEELARVRAPSDAPRGVFADVQVNGWVSGGGTLTADVARAAGFDSLGEALGFDGAAQVSLEQLLVSSPDVLVVTHNWYDTPALAAERFEHPALVHLMESRKSASVSDSLWACGGPFTLEAVRRIGEAGTRAGGGASEP
jgi:iron complex transport system substrate-binding protein